MCCYQPFVYGIQNPVTFSVVKLPVLCTADFEQLRANLASLRELANDALKLSENICNHWAWFDINATEMVHYCVDTVPYRKRVYSKVTGCSIAIP